jgi:hypothetical protein
MVIVFIHAGAPPIQLKLQPACRIGYRNLRVAGVVATGW